MRHRRKGLVLTLAVALSFLIWYLAAAEPTPPAASPLYFLKSRLRGSAEPWWTPEQLAQIKPRARTNKRIHRFPPLRERLRFETHEIWRPVAEQATVGQATHQLPRPHAPLPADYEAMGGDYLAQAPVGDFLPESANIFLLFKTGAETQWYRSVPHFMTTFTKFANFAIYSDLTNRMFGHPVIDILADLPAAVHLNHNDTERYRALAQMHQEHFQWSPEQLKMDGGWQLDKYKNLPALYDAWRRNTSCDWFVLMDDDSYILYDNLVTYLSAFDPADLIYTGNPGNTYISREWVPFAHGGSVIVCSRAVLDKLFSDEPEDLIERWALKAIEHCCGDALLAEALSREIGVGMTLPQHRGHSLVGLGGPFQANNLHGLVQARDYMCNPIISFHHLEPHDMEVLYQYERMWDLDRPITYNDIYRDFMLPYIVEERPNWVLTSDHLTTYWRPTERSREPTQLTVGNQDWYPGSSKESCRDSCRALEECVAWSFRLDECRHSESGLSLGTAANHWNRKRGWVTGYNVDRIRAWRAAAACDPLDRDAEGNWNDNEGTSEGWFLRQMAAEPEEGRYTNRKRDSTVPGLAELGVSGANSPEPKPK